MIKNFESSENDITRMQKLFNKQFEFLLKKYILYFRSNLFFFWICYLVLVADPILNLHNRNCSKWYLAPMYSGVWLLRKKQLCVRQNENKNKKYIETISLVIGISPSTSKKHIDNIWQER